LKKEEKSPEERDALIMTGNSHFESGFFHYRVGIPIHYQAGGHGPVQLVFTRGSHRHHRISCFGGRCAAAA
jgi:hypothetical protein